MFCPKLFLKSHDLKYYHHRQTIVNEILTDKIIHDFQTHIKMKLKYFTSWASAASSAASISASVPVDVAAVASA